METNPCPHWRSGPACALAGELASTVPLPVMPAWCGWCRKQGDASAAEPTPVVAGLVRNWALANGNAELAAAMLPRCRAPTSEELAAKSEGERLRDDCLHQLGRLRRGTLHGHETGCAACEVHRCEVFGEVTRGRGHEGLRSCLDCGPQHYRPSSAGDELTAPPNTDTLGPWYFWGPSGWRRQFEEPTPGFAPVAPGRFLNERRRGRSRPFRAVFLTPGFEVGGTERWFQSLARHSPLAVRWEAVVADGGPTDEALLGETRRIAPVTLGGPAATEALKSADAVVAWLFDDLALLERLRRKS